MLNWPANGNISLFIKCHRKIYACVFKPYNRMFENSLSGHFACCVLLSGEGQAFMGAYGKIYDQSVTRNGK